MTSRALVTRSCSLLTWQTSHGRIVIRKLKYWHQRYSLGMQLKCLFITKGCKSSFREQIHLIISWNLITMSLNTTWCTCWTTCMLLNLKNYRQRYMKISKQKFGKLLYRRWYTNMQNMSMLAINSQLSRTGARKELHKKIL